MDGVLLRSEEAWRTWWRPRESASAAAPVTREEFAAHASARVRPGGRARLRAARAPPASWTPSTWSTSRLRRHVWVNPEARGLLGVAGARVALRAGAVVTEHGVAAGRDAARGRAPGSDCFECVACADLVATLKPAPDLVLYALEPAGRARPGAALMVGDSRYDRGAAGARGRPLRGPGAGWRRAHRAAERAERVSHRSLCRSRAREPRADCQRAGSAPSACEAGRGAEELHAQRPCVSPD